MPTSITWDGALIAVRFLVIGFVLAWLIRFLARRALRWRGRGPSSARVFSSLAFWVVAFLTISSALTVFFPSVKPVDVLGGVTVVTIAAGIAFQTVLGNMFAGFVLLARDSFRVDDQIAVGDVSGQVVAIGLSSTVVRTFDGRMVVVPNTVLHNQVVTVQTGYEKVRSRIDITLDENTDLAHARRVAVEAMRMVSYVVEDPAPAAFLTLVGDATVTLELRFWSGARQLETVEARDAVIDTVLRAFADQGVLTGSDAVVIEPGRIMRDTLRELTGTAAPEAPRPNAPRDAHE